MTLQFETKYIAFIRYDEYDKFETIAEVLIPIIERKSYRYNIDFIVREIIDVKTGETMNTAKTYTQTTFWHEEYHTNRKARHTFTVNNKNISELTLEDSYDVWHSIDGGPYYCDKEYVYDFYPTKEEAIQSFRNDNTTNDSYFCSLQ